MAASDLVDAWWLPVVTRRVLRGRDVTLTTGVPPGEYVARIAAVLNPASASSLAGVAVGSVATRSFIVQMRASSRSLVATSSAVFGTISPDGAGSTIRIHLAVPPMALLPDELLAAGGVLGWLIVAWMLVVNRIPPWDDPVRNAMFTGFLPAIVGILLRECHAVDRGHYPTPLPLLIDTLRAKHVNDRPS